MGDLRVSGIESAADAPPAALAGLTRFYVVPHTHWDREWYLPFEDFQLRLADVVDELLEILERDTNFSSVTLDGQAIVLEVYLEVRPENEARLRTLLGSARISRSSSTTSASLSWKSSNGR